MLQLGGNPDLAQEPLGTEDRRYFGAGYLDRDAAIVFVVVSQVNRGRATAPQLTDDLAADSWRNCSAVVVALSRRSTSAASCGSSEWIRTSSCGRPSGSKSSSWSSSRSI